MAKTIEIKIPDYLTIEQYQKILKYKGDSNLERAVHTISSITGLDTDTVSKIPVSTLTSLAKDYGDLLDSKNEFHSILEWNGQLYGYSNINNHSLGEYIDLEYLAKDFENNMHKICALIYRPISRHKFNTLKFAIKQKIKMLNNDVENVFDWYELQPYDSKERQMVEEQFKQFPANIFLGAISFFLSVSGLYSTSILFSKNNMTHQMMKQMMKDSLELLSTTTGNGGGLSTNSLSPIYLKLQEINR